MPHFAGAANPYMDSFAKAAFVGITLETTMSDMYKAVMEGVTYEMLFTNQVDIGEEGKEAILKNYEEFKNNAK